MSKQIEALEATVELWHKIVEIPAEEKHPDDTNDLRFHIHAIQNILYTQLYKKGEGKPREFVETTHDTPTTKT